MDLFELGLRLGAAFTVHPQVVLTLKLFDGRQKFLLIHFVARSPVVSQIDKPGQLTRAFIYWIKVADLDGNLNIEWDLLLFSDQCVFDGQFGAHSIFRYFCLIFPLPSEVNSEGSNPHQQLAFGVGNRLVVLPFEPDSQHERLPQEPERVPLLGLT